MLGERINGKYFSMVLQDFEAFVTSRPETNAVTFRELSEMQRTIISETLVYLGPFLLYESYDPYTLLESITTEELRERLKECTYVVLQCLDVMIDRAREKRN